MLDARTCSGETRISSAKWAAQGLLRLVVVSLYSASFSPSVHAQAGDLLERCRLSLEYCASLSKDSSLRRLSKTERSLAQQFLEGNKFTFGVRDDKSARYVIEVLDGSPARVRDLCELNARRFAVRDLSELKKALPILHLKFIAAPAIPDCERLRFPQQYVTADANDVSYVFGDIYRALLNRTENQYALSGMNRPGFRGGCLV
jgi:hypothetical protein